MRTQCWRLDLKGKRSADEVQSAVGESGGTLLRIHSEKGRTQVYFTARKSAATAAAKAMKKAAKPEKVAAREVTKLA